MKIVVTGHEGFIGHHFSKYIDQHICYETIIQYDKKNGIAGDLNDSAVTNKMPDVDVVLHLAAINGTKLFYQNPTDVCINNTLPTINLINRYRNTDTKFVFASTCEMFNDTIDNGYYGVPTDEDVPVMYNDIRNPRWSYSIPKALGENLVANSGLEYLNLRYFNIYGPGQKDHFITEFVERCLRGEYYINGNDTRSFCYIHDAVRMTDILLRTASNITINVGRNVETRVSDVAKMIMGYMGIDPDRLEVRPGLRGSAKRRCPDTTVLQSIVEKSGFTTYTPLEIGLQKTLESLL